MMPTPRGIKMFLLSESEFLDQLAVALDIFFLEISQEATSLTNHFQEAASRLVILFVFGEMILKLVDSLGQQGDLNFRTARIAFRTLKLPDNFRFPIRMQSHGVSLFAEVAVIQSNTSAPVRKKPRKLTHGESLRGRVRAGNVSATPTEVKVADRGARRRHIDALSPQNPPATVPVLLPQSSPRAPVISRRRRIAVRRRPAAGRY